MSPSGGTNGAKVVVIGLDSVPPELLFDKLIDRMPSIRRMVEEGVYGTLGSRNPQITIPVWIVTVTSKNPGRSGLYGFRHRKGFSYTDGWLISDFITPIAEKGLRRIIQNGFVSDAWRSVGLLFTAKGKPRSDLLAYGE